MTNQTAYRNSLGGSPGRGCIFPAVHPCSSSYFGHGRRGRWLGTRQADAAKRHNQFQEKKLPLNRPKKSRTAT